MVFNVFIRKQDQILSLSNIPQIQLKVFAYPPENMNKEDEI